MVYLMQFSFRTILKFFIVSFIFKVPSQLYATETLYAGIKMGFEVEVIAPVKYKPMADEKGLRHKRLLEAKDSITNELLWCLEVDSSNRDIEFVSPPFSLPLEYDKFKKASDAVFQFLNFLQPLLRVQEGININEDFLATLNEKFSSLNAKIQLSGTWPTEGIPLEVRALDEAGLRLRVKPQATYQLPLESVSSLFRYFSSKENFFNKPEEKDFLLKHLKLTKRKFDGFTDLIIYYLNNIEYTKKDYLKNQRSFKVNRTETGLKQFFIFMSRLAFSDMYQLLPAAAKEREMAKFKESLSGILDNPLFSFDYPLVKNPLYKAGLYTPNKKTQPQQYPSLLLFTDLVRDKMNFTIKQWLDSIQDPSAHKRPFILKSLYGQKRKQESKQQLKDTASHVEKIYSKSGYADDYPSFITGIQKKIRDYLDSISSPQGSELHEWKDILSPPPYSGFKDSMGTLGDIKRRSDGSVTNIDTHYGQAVLEIRRYGRYFTSVHKTWENVPVFLINEAWDVMHQTIDDNETLFQRRAIEALATLEKEE